MDANTMTRASFGKSITNDDFVGVLIYKLQRKSGLESNVGNTSKEESSTSVQLLVILERKSWCGFSVRALLIEHSNTIAWDEDKLRELYSMRYALLNKCHLTENNDVIRKYLIEDMWLLDDTTVLMTTSKQCRVNYVFEIAIYEGTKKDDTMEPLWIPLNM
jgi:hypothetical protein